MMNKKELQEHIDWLERQLNEKEIDLREFREEKAKKSFLREEDIDLLQKVNNDYLEIIRWHVNPDTAVIQFDSQGRSSNAKRM